jgi:gag-polypeptide of LTR copia-type
MSSLATEQFTTHIPHLDPKGANWANFAMHFKGAMITTRHWGYFDSSKKRPAPADEDKPTDTEVEVMECWDSEDQITSYLLIQWLPDLTAMEASHLNMAKERWEMVQKEYMAKSKYTQNDLKQAFFEMHCLKGGNVCAFLMNLKTKCNKLAAIGMAIADKDYQRTVLQGIPDELARFASQLLTLAHLVHSSSTVDVKELIQAICKEADHLKIQCMHHQNQGKDGKKGQTDKALAATHSDNASRRRRHKGKCHNCGKPRHWAHKC